MELLSEFRHIPFLLLATASVVCSLGMIFNPNLVRAGFTLIGAFVAIAGLYFMLNANFVAISQILIYAVGIVLVIIFAIMLCSLKETVNDISNEEQDVNLDIHTRRVTALIVCAGLFALLVYVINSQDWNAIAVITGAEMHTTILEQFSRHYTEQIGNLMLSKYLIPFELISILLLLVLVGVIILSKKQLDTVEENKA
ncbi:MAG: NADH-quinone oxidoreductase subunit J [Candidatus Caenarcaniphilales bacterium]|jgi:NADH:ubiquinone oxidoreductase subunit 6 (subunit J)|nr:NADH-quinone oxidoreductase subunit J [Candidatus Caenarcaniphilales bacterium]